MRGQQFLGRALSGKRHGTHADLEGAQGGLRGDGAHLAELHRAGRSDPRTALPEVLEEIERMAQAVQLRVANVFHAGDGNLHPLVLYDRRIAGQEDIALDLSYRILHLCVDKGGSITGEHGVGREKQQAMGYMFSEPDLATMQRVRIAFDPTGIANPDKVFPRTKLCGEKTGPYTPHPLEVAGVAEFF